MRPKRVVRDMSRSTFKTNPVELHRLLEDCRAGQLQLPDFQRSWVWDEDRIKSLIASISRAFPVGALMTLETGGEVEFKPRPIEGAPLAAGIKPHALLLDGQQRLTSLYQVTLRGEVVDTITPRKKKVRRWFYIDMEKALDPTVDRDEAIVGVPEEKRVRADFGREIVLELSSPEAEHRAKMFPVSKLFDWFDWIDDFNDYWSGKERDLSRSFKESIIRTFESYHVPVITLDRCTTKEAVCVVFEKVNTGGKPLDAFELVTAMYAADGHELRKDWYGDDKVPGRHRRFAETLRPAAAQSGILADVSNTDFLHAVSLFHTRERRQAAAAEGKQGKELPAVTGNRQALLSLPLEAYKKYEKQVEKGFERAARFLHMLHIYRTYDLPYQSQIVPLAAILADIGPAWEHAMTRAKLVRWYWNGVFGELYGSSVETRSARDFMEVPAWIEGGAEPSTVSETIFRADRLKTMRMRLSAAYKGVNALLMLEGAHDFRSGQKFDHIVFFGENVDIHHVFPQEWCKSNNLKNDVYDSIINKTPLSFRTNRAIGGWAPSKYIEKLEKGDVNNPPIPPSLLDSYLASHLADPRLLRRDDFSGFMADRQARLLRSIEAAMGRPAYQGPVPEEGEDDERDEDGTEAEMTMGASVESGPLTRSSRRA